MSDQDLLNRRVSTHEKTDNKEYPIILTIQNFSFDILFFNKQNTANIGGSFSFH